MNQSTPLRNKILIFGLVSKHSGRNHGGTATCVRRLAEFCAENGLHVDLLTSKPANDYSFPKGLANVIDVKMTNRKSKFGLFCVLLKHVMGARPDVLLALDTRASQIASWLSYVPMNKTRIWASFHSQLNKSHRQLLRRIANRSNGIITVSQGLGDDFSRLTGIPRGQIHVLYNLAVTSGIESLAKEPVDHPWLQNKTFPVLIGVGRLVPEKGFDFLIKALAQVNKIDPSVRLILLGQGPLLRQLRELAERLGLRKNVDFAGFKDNPWAYMSKADLFVMSSLHEGFGNVLAEALSLGVPVVASNCPYGPAEILQNGRYGQLVPPADSVKLAEAILSSLENKLPRATLIEAAQRFREETAGQKYLETLGLRKTEK